MLSLATGVLISVEESKVDMTYVGPKLNRDSEANQTFFTWENCRDCFSSQEMSASKAYALLMLRMTERLLDDTPTYDNFIKIHCFTVDSRQYKEITHSFEIIKDMYQLEYHIATSLNVRLEKRRLFTGACSVLAPQRSWATGPAWWRRG